MVAELSTSQHSIVREVYEDVREQFHNVQSSDDACLLLPSVSVQQDTVTALDKVATKARLIELERQRDHAIKTARHYRDLAKSLKTTNRHLKLNMYDKIETVRNFWQNNIKEEET